MSPIVQVFEHLLHSWWPFWEVIQPCKRCLHHLSPAGFWHEAMGWQQKHEPREEGSCYHCVVNARKGQPLIHRDPLFLGTALIPEGSTLL